MKMNVFDNVCNEFDINHLCSYFKYDMNSKLNNRNPLLWIRELKYL